MPQIILTCVPVPQIILTCVPVPQIILTCVPVPQIILTCVPVPQIIIMKVVFAVLALVAAVSARGAFQLSGGYYDVLGREPSRAFSCEGRSYGYYADVDMDCEVFHVCVPISDDYGTVQEINHYSFFCGNQTIFSQDTLTCARREDAFPCDQAEGYYDIINAEFGVVPEE